ncbi:mitochondrial fission ELM1 family protein [bacterium]|nr:mitochondrial fission ELM1 family protein [bacterium]
MKILILDDGYKGNFNQSLGIAKWFPKGQLNIINVTLKGPQYSLFGRKGKSPFSVKIVAILSFFGAWTLAKRCLRFIWDESYKIDKKEFDLIISAGSMLAPINLVLTKNLNRAKSVNIMTPSMIRLKLFDFLVIPYHDYLKLRKKNLQNLIVTLGAPNTLTDNLLFSKKDEYEKKFKVDKTKKTIGVLIGGDDQNYKISYSYVKTLTDTLFSEKNRYNFIFTTSRRTDTDVVQFLKQRLLEEPSVIYSEFPEHSTHSLYPQILSLCDFIIVTEDSVNMVSEASSLGVPVLIIQVERKKKKKLIFDFTIEKFVEKGYSEYVSLDKLGSLYSKLRSTSPINNKKLREAEECAQKILEKLN